MLDCYKHLLPASRLTASMLSVSFIRVFSPINVPFFSQKTFYASM